MSETAPEPTMEEILASIRRIISEDDAPGAEASPQPANEPFDEPFDEPPPAPEAVAVAEAPSVAAADDVLELTERVTPPTEIDEIETYDIDAPPAPVAQAAPAPAPAPESAPSVGHRSESLVSEPSARAAASAFGNLSAAIAMPAAGRTLEDLTRELLRPLLKEWLDANLPRIVEAKVAEEVERISRTLR